MQNFWVSPNFLLIECQLTPSAAGSQSKNPFGTQKELQNKKIVAIETYSAQDTLNSPLSNGIPVISANVFQSCFVTFYRASIPATANSAAQTEGLYYDNIPLSRLRICTNQTAAGVNLSSSANELFRVLPTEFSWTKSYVTSAPSVPMPQTCAALFGVHYLNQGQDWRPYGS